MSHHQYTDPKLQESPPPYTAGYQPVPPPVHPMPPPPMAHTMQPQLVQVPGMTVVHTNMAPGVSHVIVARPVGPKPSAMTCSSCRYEIVTRVEMKPSLRTHLWALVLCVLGCWPLACVPYCIDSCNNVDHYCPSCNAFIGTYY